MNVLPVIALLQQAPAGRGGSLLPFLFQVVAIFGIFYFIMIRPQQKQRRQHEDRLRNLKRGDRIVTAAVADSHRPATLLRYCSICAGEYSSIASM